MARPGHAKATSGGYTAENMLRSADCSSAVRSATRRSSHLMSPRFPTGPHLPQVMLQVIDVIHEQPGQGDFRPAPDPAGSALPLLRHAPGDVEDVRVVSPPKVDKIGPPGT